MKIYTKTGDNGQTSLLGGTRVPKYELRIESYGTIDELNSQIGLLRDQDMSGEYKHQLIEIQDRLFTIGSHLAADPQKNKVRIPPLNEADIHFLEHAIDEMNLLLPEMRNFVLPGGHPTVSICHIARCICRRGERAIVHLSDLSVVETIVLKYINRLSDYLFVLSRKLSADLGAIETPWKPRM